MGLSNNGLNSVDIILCCCLILFFYIHEQQKMTRLITVLSSTNTAVAVAGLEMPNLLQTQESEEAKDPFMVQRQKGDATPLNPNKRLAILGDPVCPLTLAAPKSKSMIQKNVSGFPRKY